MDAPRTPVDKTTLGVLVALVVVLIVALVGVASVRHAEKSVRRAAAMAASTTSTTLEPTGVPTTTVAGVADGLSLQQRRQVEEIKVQVSAIRGLAWTRDLAVRVISKDELGRKVKALTAADVAKHRDELAADESVLKVLQLIPRTLDYVKATGAILAGGVLGFYDEETKELYVGGAGGATLDVPTRSVLVHELTHALTDQHFDFGPTARALDGQQRTEESAALTAVIEGDAELVRTLWEEKHLSTAERVEAKRGGSNDGGAYDKAPPYLLRSLFFPYDDGLKFVRSRFQAGGFAEVDNAYRKPPVSTEQILHPELYIAGQGWVPPKLPDLAAATGCSKVATGTLGEFDMGEVLASQLTATDARRAAGGWNGDAFGVVRCGTSLGFAQRWQTDTAADAGRLIEALARWSRGWSGSTRAPDGDGRFSGPTGSGRLVQGPSRVDVVLADDVATADRISRVLAAA